MHRLPTAGYECCPPIKFFLKYFNVRVLAELSKVTVTYSEVEDRICMSALVKEGDTVVFWLTYRLCSRLIPALTGHLERTVSRSALVDMGLLLACQQRDAEWQHEPSEPVRLSGASLVVLPERVDLSCSADSVILQFLIGDGEMSKLQMSMLEVRQWLAIVHRQFEHAGWPMQVWPEWFTETEHGPGRN